jgi:transketolase
MMNLEKWNELDDQAIAISRALAMDAVENVGNGHPGTAMALAPVAYTLFQRIMKHNPAEPKWIARDRFILSCGHSSLTLYIQLFLSGYGVELEDLKRFRKLNSLTPGHPEYGHTVGVETTTGPLGQGLANGVGMAMSARYEKGLLDPEGKSGLFDHNIWVICSDGDLQEGVSAEASSLAGTQALGNLKVIYDDNRISIEGDTHVAFTENISARYQSYGWQVIEVDTKNDGDIDREQLEIALIKASEIKVAPVLIRVKSVIAWPAPRAKGTAKSHGSALGADEIAKTKELLNLDPTKNFIATQNIIDHARKVKQRGIEAYNSWLQEFENWRIQHPERAKLLDRLQMGELPKDWARELPVFSTDKEIATRAASGKVIQAIAKSLPEFWGGSADLAESNNTSIESGGSFLPTSSKISSANPFGRVIHFGIREHAMAAILNGIALHGLIKPFAGTFLVFSDYMRAAVRLSALMKLPVTYVWTHDSIGLGEDGPTHQPIEQLAALRAMPGLAVVRPADANEVSICWREIIERSSPSGLILTRQNLPVIDRSKYASAANAVKGAYVLAEGDEKTGSCDVILIASGSEVSVAMKTRELLFDQGIKARVVSAPCLEWFYDQSIAYQQEVLPPAVKARVSIEAAVAQSWYRIVGDYGVCVSIENFGASASASELFQQFGFTPNAIAEKAKISIRNVEQADKKIVK